FAQGPLFGGRLLVRSKTDLYALVPTITKTIRAVAATQPVEHASTLEDVRTEVLANNRVNAIVFGGFAALALATSLVGPASPPALFPWWGGLACGLFPKAAARANWDSGPLPAPGPAAFSLACSSTA